MRLGKKLSIGKGDLIIISAVLVIAAVLIGVYFYQSQDIVQGAILMVTDADGNEQEYDLSQDQQITVRGPIGDSLIEIAAGAASFIESPCPDHICINVFGWISKEPQLSYCLPNGVLVRVIEPPNADEN